YVNTTNVRNTGKSASFGTALEFPNDPLNAEIEYREVQQNYDAAIGFTPRSGLREINPRISYSPRPRQHPWIRRFNFLAAMDWYLRPSDNVVLTRNLDFTVLQIDTHRQDSVQVHVMPQHELLETNFRIAPGI